MEDAAVQTFEKLYEVTRRLFSEHDLKGAISAIVDVTVDLIGADYASVILFDQEGRVVDEVENLSGIEPLSKRIRSDGITHHVVSSGKPVFVSDTSLHEATNPELRKSDIRSYVGMPLTVDDCVRAVLYVYSAKPHAFDDHQKILTTMAGFAELAVRNADLVEKMKELAIRDGLTGLYNYRYFYERLDEESNRYRRSGQPFTVVFMDLNDFKYINDTFGHPNGDYALQHFATVCRQSVRSSDIVARTGGDEVVMLLPATSCGDAHLIVERIRGTLHDSPMQIPTDDGTGPALRLTMSAGIACCPNDTEDQRELIKIADERLFREKRAIRERRSQSGSGGAEVQVAR
jgi:two-component system cell cycle response regulator